jgi:hypothetical protein
MAVALGLVGGAAVAGAAAVYNAKREVGAVMDNKVQKKIDKKCAAFDKDQVHAEMKVSLAEIAMRLCLSLSLSHPSHPPLCFFQEKTFARLAEDRAPEL